MTKSIFLKKKNYISRILVVKRIIYSYSQLDNTFIAIQHNITPVIPYGQSISNSSLRPHFASYVLSLLALLPSTGHKSILWQLLNNSCRRSPITLPDLGIEPRSICAAVAQYVVKKSSSTSCQPKDVHLGSPKCLQSDWFRASRYPEDSRSFHYIVGPPCRVKIYYTKYICV